MANRSYSEVSPMNVMLAPGLSSVGIHEAVVVRQDAAALTRQIVPGLQPTPQHDLINHGGKTLPNLTFTNFYVGGDQAWNGQDRNNIDQALAAAMSDVNLNNVMEQYFGNQPITSTFRPSHVLPDPTSAIVSKGDAENLILMLQANGTLNGFDPTSTVFNLMLPSGVVLTTDAAPTTGQAMQTAQTKDPNRMQPGMLVEDAADSKNGLGGYHGSVHVANANGGQDTIYYYAIGVFSEVLPDGSANGIPVFDRPWKNVVATFYHELNEARTDADVEDANKGGGAAVVGWTSQQGEEIGDFPVFEAGNAGSLQLVFQEVPLANGTGTVPIQFMYSNAVHGPEGPFAAGATVSVAGGHHGHHHHTNGA